MKPQEDLITAAISNLVSLVERHGGRNDVVALRIVRDELALQASRLAELDEAIAAGEMG